MTTLNRTQLIARREAYCKAGMTDHCSACDAAILAGEYSTADTRPVKLTVESAGLKHARLMSDIMSLENRANALFGHIQTIVGDTARADRQRDLARIERQIAAMQVMARHLARV